MTDRDCMFQLPTELTGIGCMCALLKTICNMSKDCIGFKKHTKESRKALNTAIKLKRMEEVER